MSANLLILYRFYTVTDEFTLEFFFLSTVLSLSSVSAGSLLSRWTQETDCLCTHFTLACCVIISSCKDTAAQPVWRTIPHTAPQHSGFQWASPPPLSLPPRKKEEPILEELVNCFQMQLFAACESVGSRLSSFRFPSSVFVLWVLDSSLWTFFYISTLKLKCGYFLPPVTVSAFVSKKKKVQAKC